MSDEAQNPNVSALIRDVAHRLRAVVDEESECHETICSMMGQLVMGDESDRPGMNELVEALQYFDRLQQRIAALCNLVENLADSMCTDADPAGIAQEFCRTAPVARDAEWLAGHPIPGGGRTEGTASA